MNATREFAASINHRWLPELRAIWLSNVGFVLAIVVGVVMSWQLSIDLGGAGVVAPYWFFLPIVLAAYRFGHRATGLTSVVATVFAGPLLPGHVVQGVGVAQTTSAWVARGLAFVVFGQVMTLLFIHLRQERDSANQELTDRRHLEVNLARQDIRFASMVRRSSDLVTIVSGDGLIEYQSPSSIRLLGRRADEFVGSNFTNLLHPEDRSAWTGVLVQASHHPEVEATVNWRLRRHDGTYVPVESRVGNLLDDPAISGIVVSSRDVSERQRLEEELRHHAFHDSLTGLANRALFGDRLEQALARLERTQNVLGVLFLDLDEFKTVNDDRGHAIGDQVLRMVAERLRETVRVGETVARLGGDEFGIIVEGNDASYAAEVAERILENLRRPFDFGGAEGFIRASIGIATTSDSLDSPGELLRHADVAMYAAKGAGKGRYQMFNSGLHDQVIGRLQLEAELGLAIERDELVIHYQPIYDLRTEQALGVEALLRWIHPNRGFVSPMEFIPAAETSGHIVPIGRWVLGRACREVRALQRETELFDLNLSVNVSARQLDDPDLVDDVATALDQSGLPPEQLTLEITESAVMTDSCHGLAVLGRLKDLGVRLSIDDFGTGYSSLAYLQQLPVDELKIDRSFVAATDDGTPESASLVNTIVTLAESFGLRTVAEGIETKQQWDNLRDAGCEVGQGFLFAKPMDPRHLHRALVRAVQSPSPVG